FPYCKPLVGIIHPYPTRRSSDLVRADWSAGSDRLDGSAGSDGSVWADWSAGPDWLDGSAGSDGSVWADWSAGPDWVDWRVWPRRDRKSTRLNSSHLGISYAVFCI